MKAILLILLGITSCVLAADADERSQRCKIEGVWYNELGSKMEIDTASETGVLMGKYYTAVESEPGSAGKEPSTLIGYTSPNGFIPTFGLTVIWLEGQSVTSWTGQCFLCNDEEILRTTWILESYTDCDNYWGAYGIGQDTFKRYEWKDAARRQEDAHLEL